MTILNYCGKSMPIDTKITIDKFPSGFVRKTRHVITIVHSYLSGRMRHNEHSINNRVALRCQGTSIGLHVDGTCEHETTTTTDSNLMCSGVFKKIHIRVRLSSNVSHDEQRTRLVSQLYRLVAY
jgi:hypothetical protein